MAGDCLFVTSGYRIMRPITLLSIVLSAFLFVNLKSLHGQESVRGNRLATESSPYLLQHAKNPVDWYPWGQEAFERAKKENKLVFLSVGYAACHWCHVMERESFEDQEIAAFLNERFICVKVDREERPDVDQIYMTAVQLVSGNGGWPMSVFVLPDARPFWGGTYFPARDGDRGNATGFLTVIEQIDQAWKQQAEQVNAQAQAVTEAIQARQLSFGGSDAVRDYDQALVQATLKTLRTQYDSQFGGFSSGDGGPKFPEPSNLWFLRAVALGDSPLSSAVTSESGSSAAIQIEDSDAQAKERKEVLPKGKQDDGLTSGSTLTTEEDNRMSNEFSADAMLKGTLDGMIRGGMYDHLGGGFHRYSVDPQWQIPHFEKMLYDNAQLAIVFANAAQSFDNDEYRLIADGICQFLLRELRDERGGFYSSIDADSEGEEGKFYYWNRDELKSFQAIEIYDDYASLYQLDGEPNFESLHYVLAPKRNLLEVAHERGQTLDEMLEPYSMVTQMMMAEREKRVRPMTDTKILTAWNGLAIAALADAGRLLGEKEYLSASVGCLDFVMQHSRDADGRFLRSYAKGKAQLRGYLDDYAFVISGILALHRATGEERLLVMAADLMDEQIRWFWDDKEGGFFFTASDQPESIVRLKNPIDGAIPSGISVSAENLLYLIQHRVGGDQVEGQLTYGERLNQTMRSVVPLITQAPGAATRLGAVAVELGMIDDNQ
jgi:uncharacterized protein YyaL (SSP411 family)